MELGISPIVTSGLVMQLLAGSKMIDIDNSVKADRELLAGAQKLLGVLITIGEAVAYVVSGMYGDVKDLGTVNAVLIILQLCFAGIIIIWCACVRPSPTIWLEHTCIGQLSSTRHVQMHDKECMDLSEHTHTLLQSLDLILSLPSLQPR